MRVIGFGFGLTNFVGKKNFGVKEKIWVKKIFGQKNFRVKKIFGSKTFLGQKKIWVKNF